MPDWILTTTRLPTLGQSVDWLNFRSHTILDGFYRGIDFWQTLDGLVVASAHISAWRPAFGAADTATDRPVVTA